MRKFFLYASAALALCGCQASGSSSTLAVPVNTEREIDHFIFANPDCSSLGATTIRVIEQPANGRMEIRQGSDFPNFPTSNQRSVCNSRRVASTQVWYIPNAGFSGTDTARVDAIGPSGFSTQKPYSISVR
jgi:hypothetical protein